MKIPLYIVLGFRQILNVLGEYTSGLRSPVALSRRILIGRLNR